MDDLRQKANTLEDLAKQYGKHRMACAKNRIAFKYILASKLPELRAKKSNAGIDALELMLLADGDPEVTKYYEAWHMHEDKYKSIDKLIEAIRESLHLEKFLGRIE